MNVDAKMLAHANRRAGKIRYEGIAYYKMGVGSLHGTVVVRFLASIGPARQSQGVQKSHSTVQEVPIDLLANARYRRRGTRI